MSAYLRKIPINSTEPVKYVCYHPVAEKWLKEGKPAEPSCLANDYEFDTPTHELCNIFGWQGGTIHQVVAEVRRLAADRAAAVELVRELAGALVTLADHRRQDGHPAYSLIDPLLARAAAFLNPPKEKLPPLGDVVAAMQEVNDLLQGGKS